MSDSGPAPRSTVATAPEGDAVQELVTVARLYYEEELSQQEIAERLSKSRPTISRMLKAARSQGIVTIEIRAPSDRSRTLELALEERFGLGTARVLVMPRGEVDSTDRLGQAAASYLQLILRDGLTVGVSNGRTLAATARYLHPERSLQLEVVQIIGALGNESPRIDGPDIARALADAYDTDCRYLHVPLLVESVTVKETLVRDRNISQTLRMGSEADVAIVGIGGLDPEDQSPIFDGFLTPEDMARSQAAGAVGHCCGEFFTVDGTRARIDINDRTIAIGLDALRKIPTVLAVAGGARKAAAILGAVRGGFINTLITDDRAAVRMLETETEER
ncbi:MAG TPA: sugar-binding transcriptional regulator [Solirubrobacteraceae bacterium]|nr:sugar-binding transcriptional regulator [Solirubrobacteraceae bacterium]